MRSGDRAAFVPTCSHFKTPNERVIAWNVLHMIRKHAVSAHGSERGETTRCRTGGHELKGNYQMRRSWENNFLLHAANY